MEFGIMGRPADREVERAPDPDLVAGLDLLAYEDRMFRFGCILPTLVG